MPWRQYQRCYQQLVIKRLLMGSMLFTMVFLFCIHFILSIFKHDLGIRIKYLQSEYQLANPTNLKTDQLLLTQIKNLYAYQAATQDLLLILSNVPEKKVCFAEITRAGNSIAFSGLTPSAIDLTEFLHSWKMTNLFSEINIIDLQQLPKTRLLKFRLRATKAHIRSPLFDVSQVSKNEI